MSIMLTGGCDKCNRICATGLDAHMLDGNKIVSDSYPIEPGILCYSCYDKHYSEEAIRGKKLHKLLTPWYKRLLNSITSPFVRYFKYIGLIQS